MQTSESSSPDWPSLVFEEGFMASVDKMAKRRFGQNATAEECASYVLERLAEDDWGKCKQFQGRSKPTTFLVSLSNNLIEEFSRKTFGRPRPPVWLKEQGDLWVKLWKAVCLERQMVQSVTERFCQNGLRAVEMVSDAIRVIKARIPSCGQAGVGTCDTDDGDIESLSDLIGQHASGQVESSMDLEGQVQQAFSCMVGSVFADESDDKVSPLSSQEIDSPSDEQAQLSNKLLRLKEALQLSDEESLLLRLVFVDGLSKSKAAVAAGMQSHKGGRIVNEALARVREAFESCDMDIESLYASMA